jgi:signal transduction histidine kinase
MREMRVSSKRIIGVTLAIVVVAFIGSSGYAEYRAARTQSLTAEIASDESPSIEHLAAARAELRDLHRLLSTYVLLATNGQSSSHEPLRKVRERLRMNLAAYFALPARPRERALWPSIDKELADVDSLSMLIVGHADGARFSEARRLLVEVLPSAIDEESDAIMAAITLNATRVREVANQIEGERRSRMLWVFGLDGLSLVLAVVLALLALRTIARQESLQRRRSDELEGFAGRVAHDLLNPLAAAGLSIDAAIVTSEPARRTVALGRARRSLARAQGLIDDLLAFARAGAPPCAGSATTVDEVIEGVLEEQRAPAAARGITLAAELPAARVGVRCTAGVLNSILSNLVRNAVKYMGERPVRRVSVRALGEGDRIRFEVEDTGPGLPPDLGDRIFDPYVRGVGNAERGLGLGLATVRRLVQGHGGRWGVRSLPGTGSTFWFELPAASPPVPLIPAPSDRPPGAPMARLGAVGSGAQDTRASERRP